MERWMKKIGEEEARLSTAVAFEAYRRPLVTLTLLKYLVRIVTAL